MTNYFDDRPPEVRYQGIGIPQTVYESNIEHLEEERRQLALLAQLESNLDQEDSGWRLYEDQKKVSCRGAQHHPS